MKAIAPLLLGLVLCTRLFAQQPQSNSVPAAPPPKTPAAHNFTKWEREIAAFEEADRTNPPPRDASLFIGSSTIRFWKTLAQDFPDHPVINRGFGGSEIVDATHFAPRIVFPCKPRMIFLRAGGNDLWAGKNVEQVFADYKEFVSTIRATMPDTDIAFIGVSPSIARWSQHGKEKSLNTVIENYCKHEPHLKYVEDYDIVLDSNGQPRPELFVADKLHINAEGYKLLTERVRPFLPKR